MSRRYEGALRMRDELAKQAQEDARRGDALGLLAVVVVALSALGLPLSVYLIIDALTHMAGLR